MTRNVWLILLIGIALGLWVVPRVRARLAVV